MNKHKAIGNFNIIKNPSNNRKFYNIHNKRKYNHTIVILFTINDSFIQL